MPDEPNSQTTEIPGGPLVIPKGDDNPLAELLETATIIEGENSGFDPSKDTNDVLGTPDPEPVKEEAVPGSVEEPDDTPGDPEAGEKEEAGEETEEEPVYTKSQFDKMVALNAFVPETAQQQAQEAPEGDPAPQVAQEAAQAAQTQQAAVAAQQAQLRPTQIPLMDQDRFDKVVTDPESLQEYMGEYAQSIKAETYLEVSQSMRTEFINMYQDQRALEQFIEAHPAIDGKEALLHKAIMKVRAEHPEIDTRDGLLDLVSKELDFLPTLRVDIEKAVKGKKIDVVPKGRARSGKPAARGKISAPGETPEKPYDPIAEFAELNL